MLENPENTGNYDPKEFPPFAVTVDIVLFTIVNKSLRVLLIQRGAPPFRDAWALPGGFVLPDETLDHAAERELSEETGIHKKQKFLEQLGTYGHPERDPRMRVVTVAHWAIIPNLPEPTGGSDAKYAELVPVSEIESGRIRLAFDHNTILKDAIERARSKLEYSTIATNFCEKEFSISELREVYETVWNTKLDPGNFQRKILQAKDSLIPLNKRTKPGEKGGKPATVYATGTSKSISPPLTRPKT